MTRLGSMLEAAIIILGVTVAAGMWLGVMHLLFERAPGRLTWKGAAHGLGGLAGVTLLLLALFRPHPALSAHAMRMGAGGFADAAGALLTAALFGGFVMLAANLRRKPISGAIVAAHSMAAIFGYVLLATYLTLDR